MALVNPYTTLEDLKSVLDIDILDTTDDVQLEKVINSVSRWIEKFTTRRFYKITGEARYFSAQGPRIIETDDMLDITSVAIDEDGSYTYSTTLDSGDYSPEPRNAPVYEEPYTCIVILPNADNTFPKGLEKVKVTGDWGYCETTPDDVARACLIQCHRMWKRRDMPFGVSGPNAFGQVQALTRLDPDVEEMLAHYCRGL